MKRVIFVAVLMQLLALPPALADKAILILDASGSMWGQTDGQSKIDIARKVVADILTSWPQKTELGLIAYGHREKANCNDIETLVPIGSVNASGIKAAVDSLNPKGKTPLTEAVKLAAKELRSTEEKATVILVSDGLETCKADPCAIASELEKSGVDFTVHVVGFGTSNDENRQLQCLADNTGGRLLSANNASELKTALVKTVELVEKSVQEKNISVKMRPMGHVSLRTLAQEIAKVIDASGREVATVGWFKPESVAPGRYKLIIQNTITTEIEVTAGGHTVIDVTKFGGWLGLNGRGAIGGHVYDLQGKEVGLIDTLNPPKFFLPGSYRLYIGDGDKEGTFVELKAGDKVIVKLDN